MAYKLFIVVVLIYGIISAVIYVYTSNKLLNLSERKLEILEAYNGADTTVHSVGKERSKILDRY